MPITDKKPDALNCLAASTGFPPPTNTLIESTVGAASHTGLVRPNNTENIAAIVADMRSKATPECNSKSN